MKEQIIELEKQILDLRIQLNELMRDDYSQSDAVMKDKMNFLKAELLHLNRQHEMLSYQLEKRMQVKPQVQPPQPVQEVPQVQPPQPVQEVPQVQLQQPVQEVPQVQPAQPVKVAPQPQTLQRQSFENKFGASFMGIVASCLVFISIILFATLALPYLTKPIQMVICYVVSFSLIGVALYKLKKMPKNKFYLSLAACGMGSLYISLLLTNMYFKYINDFVLFFFIAIWAVGMVYLSKAKNRVFMIIAHIGVFISVILGSILCVSQEDYTKFMFLTIYFVIVFGTLYATHYERNVDKNVIANVFGILNIGILCVMCWGDITLSQTQIDSMRQVYTPFAIVIAIVIVALIAVLFISDWTDTKVSSGMSYGLSLSAYAGLMFFVILIFVKEETGVGMLIYAFSMLLLLATEFKKKSHNEGALFLQSTMLLSAFVAILYCQDIYKQIYMPLYIAPVLALGVYRKSGFFKYIAITMSFIYLLFNVDMYEKLAVTFIYIAILYVIGYLKKEGTAFKVLLHLYSLITILAVLEDVLEEAIEDDVTIGVVLFAIVAIFNGAMLLLARYRKENDVVYNIVNGITMFAGLMHLDTEGGLKLIVIAIVVAIFCINSKNMLDKNEMFSGMYVGFKFTVLLICILVSFEAIDYVISISLILVSIICIVLGFAKKYKALRIYGLVLVMISVFKLIMIDIHYDNTLGNALSFFISGMLCFAISMIYNYIGKKLSLSDSV